MGIAYYLKIASIPGECPAKNHTNEIEVISWSWGGTHPINMGGSGTSGGIVKMSDLAITKPVDKSSPKLLSALCQSTIIPTATLTCSKSGTGTTPGDFLTITLTNAVVSGFQSGGLETKEAVAAIHGGTAVNRSGGIEGTGMSGTDRETEMVTFAYEAVEYSYKIQSGSSFTSAGSASYNNKTKEAST